MVDQIKAKPFAPNIKLNPLSWSYNTYSVSFLGKTFSASALNFFLKLHFNVPHWSTSTHSIIHFHSSFFLAFILIALRQWFPTAVRRLQVHLSSAQPENLIFQCLCIKVVLSSNLKTFFELDAQGSPTSSRSDHLS